MPYAGIFEGGKEKARGESISDQLGILAEVGSRCPQAIAEVLQKFKSKLLGIIKIPGDRGEKERKLTFFSANSIEASDAYADRYLATSGSLSPGAKLVSLIPLTEIVRNAPLLIIPSFQRNAKKKNWLVSNYKIQKYGSGVYLSHSPCHHCHH